MKSKIKSVCFAFLLPVASLLTGCQQTANSAKKTPIIVDGSKLVYGLGDDDLNFIGQRLGCRVEALGMGDYSFTHGSLVFHYAENDLAVTDRRLIADGPVTLRYEPPGRKPPMETHINLAKGMTLHEVEQCFRKFMIEIEEE